MTMLSPVPASDPRVAPHNLEAEQALLGALRLTQRALGPVCSMPAQAPQRLDLTEKHIRMGHGTSDP